MPSTITHAYFAEDVYKRLKNKDKLLNNDKLKRYKMFAQSSDPLMFYNIKYYIIGKDVRDFHLYFHTHKTKEFFISLCNNIKDKKLYNNQDVLAFLYGFITHYVLDSNIHPYVVYKTGVMNKNDKSTFKYNRLHEYMETTIDNILVKEREHINPYNFNIKNFCFDTTKFDNELNTLINKTFNEVFNMDNMDKIYYKSLKDMIDFTILFRQDKYGIKKLGYSFIDLFTTKKTFPLKVLSYHTGFNEKDYFLNSNHDIWYNPVDNKITSHKSFYELYDKSIKDACNIIESVNDYFNNKKIDLNKIFTNKNYLTGLDCDISMEFKKFAF